MRYRLSVATWVVVREKGERSPRVLQSAEAVALLGRDLVRETDDDKERFWVVLLDGKNRYRMHALVSVGTLNGALVHPREVFGPALREGAASIVLIHNHPSGDPMPSVEDVSMTRRLAEVGRLVGVPVLDHVVVGNGSERWASLRELGRFDAA